MLPPEITLNPPYHTSKPIVTDDEISAIGKNIELNQTFLTRPFYAFSFISKFFI